MQLIERECGITLSVREVGNYLKHWRVTPQKPIKKTYEQRPEAVFKSGLTRPILALKPASKQKVRRFTGCYETALVNTDVRGRSRLRTGVPDTSGVYGG